MTRLRWPAPHNPRPRAAAKAAQQILDADRSRRSSRMSQADEDRAVLAAMPGVAGQIAERTGLGVDRVGAALSRLKAAGRAAKSGKQWTNSSRQWRTP